MEANNAARKREILLRGAASAARSELDGLRDDLATRAPGSDLPGSTCEAHSKRISTLETVLSQCAGRYSGLAEIADRALNDSLMYQEAWPRVP
jgi:hypothetical protein